MIRLHVLLFFLLAGFSAGAGTISGIVRDAKDTSTMVGVVVSIAGTGQGTQTDMDGRYEFRDLQNGAYTLEFNYVTYTRQVHAVVLSDSDVTLNVLMNASGNQLKGATVSTTRRTNTESAVVLEMKKSNVVVSGISAAQISKTMDRNAADVVKRIPGVTVQDDRFITVRGLADRYNTVWLNDAGAPSSETDKKAFSFDIIPSGLIDRILVFKTPSPELPGDFAGGMVKIYTTSIPDKNTYSVGISSSYRSGITGTDFSYNQKSGTDWLGYDKGLRSLPAAVPAAYVTGTEPDIPSISKSFGNDFQIYSKRAPLDLRLNGSASNVFKLGNIRLGTTLGLSYSNLFTNYEYNRMDYESAIRMANYHDVQSSNKTSVNGMANIAAIIGNSKIEFRNLYNQLGNSVVVTRNTNPDSSFSSARPIERSYAMAYESRATYAAQLSGTHHNDQDTRRYTWTLGYTDLFKNQPDLRRIKYVQEPGGKFRAAVPGGAVDPINGGGRYYASLFENVYSFSHQFTQKVSVTSRFSFDLNLGNYVEYKTRRFEARQFGYTLTPHDSVSYSLFYLPVNEIFADQNVGGEGYFRIKENTADYDRYSAANRLIASFVSLNVPLTERIKVAAGLRYEDNLYTLKGMRNQEPIEPEVSTGFLLPSINASYNFSPKSLIRAAYGKTVNRPEFRETAPFYFYDFERLGGFYGALTESALYPHGDTLKVAQIQNVDVRYEYYPSAGELIHVGGFYKHFKDPIQQITYNAGARAFTTINAASAYCYGAEVDVRKNLAFLDQRFNTVNVFRNFTIVANVAISRSELTIDTARYGNFRSNLPGRTRLEGQSDYVLNTGFFYQSDSLGLQGSLLYNVYGPRMYSIGFADDGNIGELAFHSLDLSLTKTIYRHFQISLGVQNLLDQSYRFVLDGDRDQQFKSEDLLFNTYKPGRYFTLGLRFRF